MTLQNHRFQGIFRLSCSFLSVSREKREVPRRCSWVCLARQDLGHHLNDLRQVVAEDILILLSGRGHLGAYAILPPLHDGGDLFAQVLGYTDEHRRSMGLSLTQHQWFACSPSCPEPFNWQTPTVVAHTEEREQLRNS